MLQQGHDQHIDAVLSGIYVGRRPAGGIVQDLLPIIPVDKQSNVYYKSNYKESLLWDGGAMTKRAKGGKSREVYFSVSSDTYFARNYALGSRWFDEDAANADAPIKLRQRSAQLVTDRLLLDYEGRVATLANVSTNVSTTTHVATAWSNVTGSRPYSDLTDLIEDFRELTTLKPNVIIIPEQIMTKVRKSDEVRDILFGDRGGVATDVQFANLLNIPKILVPQMFVNTAGVGETEIGSGNLNPVWGNKVFLAYVADINGTDEADTWLSAFRWTDPSFGTPWAIRVFQHNDERRSQKVEAAYYQDEKVISPDLGMAVDSVL
jgi:hypothetical protein